MKNRTFSRYFLPAIAGFLIIIAGVAFYQMQRAAANEAPVVVASGNIEPYSIVKGDQVRKAMVAESSITREDLEWSEYEDQYLARDRPLVVTQQVLSGQRLDERVIARDGKESFAVVSPDERVVGVSTEIPGAVLGKIHVGDVVDATAEGSGASEGAVAKFAKVLCISLEPNGCHVRTGGVGGAGSDDPTTGGGRPVKMLLAVEENVAGAIAGGEVTVSLNPFCRIAVNAEGNIEPGDFLGEQCLVSSERYASATRAPSAETNEEPASSPDADADAGSPAENSAPADSDQAGSN
jgi:hypothetical protein